MRPGSVHPPWKTGAAGNRRKNLRIPLRTKTTALKRNPMTPSSTLPTLKDYLTGTVIPDVGAENNRQLVLRFLVEKKG